MAIALIATLVLCGALHDLVTMAARGAIAFLFTPRFFFLGDGEGIHGSEPDEDIGVTDVSTFIVSGNVAFVSDSSHAEALSNAIEHRRSSGKP